MRSLFAIAALFTSLFVTAARAEARPDPDPSTILRHVYADGA